MQDARACGREFGRMRVRASRGDREAMRWMYTFHRARVRTTDEEEATHPAAEGEDRDK
jgi:hypothetical protein